MIPIQQPNRVSSDAWALLYSKGKVSQGPAFTPVHTSQFGLIRHTTGSAATSLLSIPTRQGRATTTAPYGRYLPCHLVRELR